MGQHATPGDQSATNNFNSCTDVYDKTAENALSPQLTLLRNTLLVTWTLFLHSTTLTQTNAATMK